MNILLLSALVRLAFASDPISPTDSHFATSSGLEVLLQSTGNTIIKAIVSNAGQQDYNIFSKNTILDTNPVDRVQITIDGTLVQSKGLRLIYAPESLHESHFVPIPAGQSVEVEFDIAETHQVHRSPHGRHEVMAVGVFQYAELNSTKIVGQIPYRSPVLTVEVDLDEAAAAFEGFHPPKDELRKRAYISDARCSVNSIRVITNAMKECGLAAEAGAEQAAKGGQTYLYWFKTDFYTRDVSQHLAAIGKECKQFNRGSIKIYCDEAPGYQLCDYGVLAYVDDELTKAMFICPLFYNLPLVTDCDDSGRSRAGIIIHEMGHFSGLYKPRCIDYAYTKGPSLKLEDYHARDNCDSLAFFAMDIRGKCAR